MEYTKQELNHILRSNFTRHLLDARRVYVWTHYPNGACRFALMPDDATPEDRIAAFDDREAEEIAKQMELIRGPTRGHGRGINQKMIDGFRKEATEIVAESYDVEAGAFGTIPSAQDAHEWCKFVETNTIDPDCYIC